VRKEMQRLCNTMLTPKQIASAKQQLKGQIAVSCDSRESFALDFSKAYLYFNEMKSIDDLFAEIDAITPQEIMNVSREIFDPNRLFTLILE
jgi:peptidase, M16 family